MSNSVKSQRANFAVYLSRNRSPFWNLAVEEQLLDRASRTQPALFLWQSRPAVVIGRNQNPWMECDLEMAAREDVWIVRRHSGGGAVYQDEGNLNYAFFMPREQYVAESVFSDMQTFLNEIGIRAERFNRTGLAVEGRKISGNAFCLRRHGAQHHGTLLINADLRALSAALKPASLQIETRATASIRAPVGNLIDWRPALTVPALIKAMTKYFSGGAAPMDVEQEIDVASVDARAAYLSTKECVFGLTPTFAVEHNQQQIRVEKGRVATLEPSTETDNTRPWFDPSVIMAGKY